jgi:DNA-binding IclR family transcriptional regulator
VWDMVDDDALPASPRLSIAWKATYADAVPRTASRPPVRTAPGRSATSRALSALDAFDSGHQVLTLSQIARRTRLPVATAHRLLAELCAARVLARRPDGAYEVGARMWRLGLLAPPTRLRETALPFLQDLVLATGHTVHLAVLDGTNALVVERLAGSRTQPTRHSPGARLPLHCTAVGKVLLAHASTAVRDEVLRRPARHTRWTVTDVVALGRQLATIQRAGVATSAQEHREGVSSLAVPVHGSSGVVAALGILAPLTSPRLTGTVGPLRAAAAAIGSALVRADLENAVGSEPEADGGV